MKSRITGISFALLLACLATVPASFTQHSPVAADAAPATLLPGMGSLHHAIATSNPEAKRFFDQGLTLVYAVNHDQRFVRSGELLNLIPMRRCRGGASRGPAERARSQRRPFGAHAFAHYARVGDNAAAIFGGSEKIFPG